MTSSDCIHYIFGGHSPRCEVRPAHSPGFLNTACEKFQAPAPQTKVCKRCGRELPVSEFNKHAISKDGYQSICKDCQQEQMTKASKVAIEKRKGLNPEKWTDADLVGELRLRGYDVKATKTIEL